MGQKHTRYVLHYTCAELTEANAGAWTRLVDEGGVDVVPLPAKFAAKITIELFSYGYQDATSGHRATGLIHTVYAHRLSTGSVSVNTTLGEAANDGSGFEFQAVADNTGTAGVGLEVRFNTAEAAIPPMKLYKPTAIVTVDLAPGATHTLA